MGRRYAVIGIVLLAVILSIAAASVWPEKDKPIMAQTVALLQTEISKALGSQVTVGDLAVSSFREITALDIKIYDKENRLLAYIPKLEAAFDLLALMRGFNPVEAISQVTVYDPQVFLFQRADGNWNVMDLFAKKQAQTTDRLQFGGLVRIIEGSARLAAVKGQYDFDKINGTLDFSYQPSMHLFLSLIHNDSPVQLEGTVNGREQDALAIRADRLALAAYRELLPANLAVSGLEGEIKNVKLSLKREQGGLSYAGEGELAGVSFDIARVKIREASGLITVTDREVQLLNTRASLWDQAVTAGGYVALDAREPVFHLTLTSQKFDPQAIAAFLPNGRMPVYGPLEVELQLAGTASDPSATGTLKLPYGQVDCYPVQNARAFFSYQDGVGQVTGLEATVFDGQVRGSGALDLSQGKFSAQISGKQLKAEDLANAQGLQQLRGSLNIDLVASGPTEDPSQTNVFGTMSLDQGELAGIPVDNAYGGFLLREGRFTVEYLNLSLDDGVVSARGTITKDSMRLWILGRHVPLALLSRKLPGGSMDGLADFNGRIEGTLAQPRLEMRFSARNGQFYAQPYETLSAQIHLNNELLTVETAELRHGQTWHKLEGTVGLTGQRETNLTLTTRQARVEQMIQAVPTDEKVTGSLDQEATISGPLDDLTVEGWVDLKEGSYRGYLLSSVNGAYHYQHGELKLDQVVLNSLQNQVILSGRLAADKTLDFDISAQDVDLVKLPFHYPYPVGGQLAFRGKLSGTLAEPHLEGQMESSSLDLNGQKLQAVEATVLVNKHRVDFPTARFMQEQSEYLLSAGYNWESREIYGDVTVRQGSLAAMAAMGNLSDQGWSGMLDGTFSLSGTLKNPAARLNGTVSGAALRDYVLGDVTIDASYRDRVLSLDNVSVKQGNGFLLMRGVADLDGEINIEAGAREIDARFFAAVFNSNLETQGQLNFTAQITGKTASPHTAMSLEILNGSVAGAGFDKLYGLFILEKGSIQVNQLLLSKGPYRASAYGTVPLAALNPSGRRQATASDQMDLTFRLDQANLSILPVMTKEVEWASGETTGEIKVSGNLVRPLLNGQITVTDGSLKFVDLKEPIQKVAVDIRFENDKILVRAFEGKIGSGTYLLTGDMSLRDLALHDYNMKLALNKIVLTHKYFQGPLQGELDLTEVDNKPHFSGKLLLEKDTVNIPPITSTGKAPAVDIGLDVEVTAGDKVRLLNPMLYDIWVTGRVHFGGSLEEPDVTGRITALRGSLNYLRTQFTISEASAAFTQYHSFEPVLALKASTRLEQTTVNLDVSGPVSELAVRLTSNPAMSQQEILSLLTLRSRYFERQKSGETGSDGLGRDELVSMLDAGLQMQFIAEVESMFRGGLGLDEFKLFRDTGEVPEGEMEDTRESYKVTFGKYVSDRLLLNYTTGVDSSIHRYGARYDLTRSISLTADVDEFHQEEYGVMMRFNF